MNASSKGNLDLMQLAGVADALFSDGRRDLAAQLVQILYYCAERPAVAPAGAKISGG
jgi:hypothetical protein